MATPNADNAEYNPGSAADQDARIRRDERIRLTAERDRVMRDLQELRATVAQEVRTLQALGGGRDATTATTAARRQAAVVAMERQLLQLEQALAATGPQAEFLTQLDEGPDFGVGPSLGGQGTPEQRDTTDIRRRQPARQLAGQASFRQVSSPQGPSIPSAATRSPAAPQAPSAGVAATGGTVAPANQLRERLNQRATRNRVEKSADQRSIQQLQAARKPDPIAWGAVTLVAIAIDVADYFLTAADVAFGLGTVISILVNIVMFLCIRAVTNRGMFLSWSLAFFMLFGIGLTSVPFPPVQFVGILMFQVVMVAGIFNSNATAVENGKQAVEENIQRMEKSILVARQTTAKAIRLARRAGKYSKRVAKLTRSVVRSKTFRTLSKGTKTSGKFLTKLGGPIANSLPVIRVIPFQLLTVWLTYRGLKRDYQEAQELLAQYAATAQEEVRAVTEAEVMRAEVAGAEIEEAESEEAFLAEEPPQAPQLPTPRAAVRTASVTDIARPGSGVAPTVRPMQQRPSPVAAIPMRDVAAAA